MTLDTICNAKFLSLEYQQPAIISNYTVSLVSLALRGYDFSPSLRKPRIPFIREWKKKAPEERLSALLKGT